MKYLILALTTITTLSCNPSKKLDKLNRKHPELLANFCRDTFPCVTTKIDTIKEIEYEFITVECPGYEPKDTIVITRDKIIKGSAVIKYEKKTNTIIKTIKDSAEIRACELELKAVNKKLIESTALNTKLQNKLTGRNSAIMWLIIALLCSIIINILLIKKW
jgi:hypothetical protein